MLVRFGGDWCFDDVEGHGSFSELHLGTGVSLEFNSSSTTPLPSDDIWKKFDLPDVPMSDWWNSSVRGVDDYDEFDTIIEQCTSATSSFWTNLDPPCSGKEAREIRHHDCMWAGHCINKEHDRTLHQGVNGKNSCFVKQEVSTTRTPTVCNRNVRTAKTNNSVNCSSASLLINNNSSVVKSNNSRSLLLSSRTNVNSSSSHSTIGNRYERQSLESDGDSPRPETPQSLSESEEEYDDHPRFRHSLGVVIRSSVAVCDSSPADFFLPPASPEKKPTTPDDEDDCTNSSMAVSVSEVTGQVCRPVEKPQVVIKTEKTDAFFSDHSYHLSKGSVKMENLGVQTPSDSEEEIDVVSVGEKQTGGRGGVNGSTTLPTNPSASDRQQLQLTVASAISAASRQHQPNSIPVRISIGDRTVSVRTVPADSLFDTDKKRKSVSSRGPSKGVKRTKYQYHHRLQHHKSGRRGGSRGTSDSEPDSCEKRSLHNDMERQRRIDLRNLVEGLRVLVPEVEDKKRAAKVVILKEAATYCHKLREQNKALTSQVSDLQKEQERLRARVSHLRRQVAAQR
ncbi:myc proto-oncogene protein [Anabrus simplex]|uniref:myc proto-oncogene protein n=1 Tax=Anabrus simplex TaxID=316456 RepID=UPI0035A3C07C